MFEWDSRKATSNELKHGISVEEAATAFLDPARLDGEDRECSESEARRLRLATNSWEGPIKQFLVRNGPIGGFHQLERIAHVRRGERRWH